jgi:hypothetical protein
VVCKYGVVGSGAGEKGMELVKLKRSVVVISCQYGR